MSVQRAVYPRQVTAWYKVDSLIHSLNAKDMSEKDRINDEWVISPMNKMPVRTSKLITEKTSRKPNKSIHSFSNNLKYLFLI